MKLCLYHAFDLKKEVKNKRIQRGFLSNFQLRPIKGLTTLGIVLTL